MGALNSLITVRQRVAGSAADGQPLDTWSTVASIWGEIRHPSGLEHIRAGVQTSVVRASIRVRRRGGITPAMQAVHGTVVYDIEAVLPDDVDRLYMFLVCKAQQ